jgi:Xaa-Pro dipeptidase
MPEGKDLAFTIEEFKERVRRVQERMRAAGIDVLLVHTPENIYYLTGYHTPGYYAYQCFIVPMDSEEVMLTRYLEESNVIARSWVENRATFQDTEDPIEVTRRTLEKVGANGKRLGIEKSCWFLTTSHYEKIVAALPEATLIDATGVVDRARLVKSPAEVAYIRQAARAAENGMKMAMEMIASGKRDTDIAAAVMNGMILAGSEYTGLPPFVATGIGSALAHATWEGRDLRKGDAVYLEIPGSIKRYHAALMRTAVVGKPPAMWEDCAKVIIEGLNAAIAAIKPGVTSGEVDQACRATIARGGYGKYYRHRCGYSIGIAFPPDWGEGHIMSLRAGDPTVLEAGMVFHMPPAALMDGVAGIGFSETVRVTDTGCEVITNFPRQLSVIE